MLANPLTGEQGFSSYSGQDVQWLLKDISSHDLEAPKEEREESVQSGKTHYSESLPVENLPSSEYEALFSQSLQKNKNRIAREVGLVAEQIHILREQPVLVSLARGGTPVGALIKRYLEKAYKVNIPHYAVSILRGRGIDYNALRYIAAHHDPKSVIFVDGWTGKGTISKELEDSLSKFYSETNIEFNPEIAVLADPGSCTEIYGTREDYLIPSACLNSTVSGLVSRTVLNDEIIGENDYHGAKYYKQYAEQDMSNVFLDEISNEFTGRLFERSFTRNYLREIYKPKWSGLQLVKDLQEEFDIPSPNLIKPGVGETTRVLLRRVPWVILINPEKTEHLRHVLLLAEENNVTVIERVGLPYSCVGLIKPIK